MSNNLIGIDIGGSITKVGVVDAKLGKTLTSVSIETPKLSSPEIVLESLKEQLPRDVSAIGFGIPCIVKDGITKTAPNIGPAWKDINFKHIAEKILNIRCAVLNDADAAAIAEVTYGAMKTLSGVTVFLTFGTGIGTAIYYNGMILPNTEFGRMALPGGIDNAEMIASAKVRSFERLRWKDYAERVNIYLAEINKCFWPDNVVIGGGVSDSWKEWGHLLEGPFKIYKAQLGNAAGMIGAATYALSN